MMVAAARRAMGERLRQEAARDESAMVGKRRGIEVDDGETGGFAGRDADFGTRKSAPEPPSVDRIGCRIIPAVRTGGALVLAAGKHRQSCRCEADGFVDYVHARVPVPLPTCRRPGEEEDGQNPRSTGSDAGFDPPGATRRATALRSIRCANFLCLGKGDYGL